MLGGSSTKTTGLLVAGLTAAAAVGSCRGGFLSGTGGVAPQGSSVVETLQGVSDEEAANRGLAASNHLPQASPCLTQAPAPRTLRRLTPLEFNNSVRDLLSNNGQMPTPTQVFAGDPLAYGFDDAQYNLLVTSNNISSVQAAAEAAGVFAAGSPGGVVACTSADAACSRQLLASFGRRAFRRPLSEQELASYADLVADVSDFSGRVRILVAALLQSPHFLYRRELGVQNGNRFDLTQYEIASELAFWLTASTPDDILLAAADGGQLANGQQLAAQAQRLLKDPRAHQAVANFFLQWLQVAQLAVQVHSEADGTSLSGEQKEAMRQEATRFVEGLVFDENGTFKDLLSARETYLDSTLASLYGVGQGADGAFVKNTWQHNERLGGVLGLGGVLASASQATSASPTYRGRTLRMRFLCQTLGLPPANVSNLSDENVARKTLRGQFTAHSQITVCANCHQLMDPLAYPLGNFDALGRRRPGDLENGEPVDLSGRVNAPAGDPADLADGEALASYLANSPQAQSCLSRHMAMYSFGQLSWREDSCTFDAARDYLAAQKTSSLQAMLVAITQTPSFTSRVMDP